MSPVIDTDFQCEKSAPDAVSPTTTATLVETAQIDIEAGEASGDQRSWLSRAFSKRAPKGPQEAPDHYRVVTRVLEEHPTGYAQVATFQSSDKNFLQYRSFGYLHCRLLSDLQYDVERLEDELEELDQFDKSLIGDLANGAYPSHVKRCRSEVLSEARVRLSEYDDFLLKAKEMTSLQRPSSRDYRSVVNWFRSNEPLVRKEAHFIRRKEDIITLRTGRESGGFDGLVESCLDGLDDFLRHRFDCHVIQNVFLTQELRDKTSSVYVRYYAPARVDKLVNALITIVIFALLILPVVTMYEVTEMGKSQSPLDAIGVLIVFTLVFGMAVSATTTAKRHELFGASAAYAAVLVVFIGNFGIQQVEMLN